MRDEFNIAALKTVCGGIFHCLVTYGRMEVGGRDWEYLHSHLHIAESTVHCVELTKKGFQFTCKALSMLYVHDSFSTDARIVEITKLPTIAK